MIWGCYKYLLCPACSAKNDPAIECNCVCCKVVGLCRHYNFYCPKCAATRHDRAGMLQRANKLAGKTGQALTLGGCRVCCVYWITHDTAPRIWDTCSNCVECAVCLEVLNGGTNVYCRRCQNGLHVQCKKGLPRDVCPSCRACPEDLPAPRAHGPDRLWVTFGEYE
jgi:hypothetical protein